MEQTKTTSPDKAKKMCLAGYILIPIGAAILVAFLASAIYALVGQAENNKHFGFFVFMLMGPSEIGLAALIAGIVLLVKGKKALPKKQNLATK
ncbi:hypothetical protein FACS1894152_0670 [Bacilli bacterium]|nr:hypothetical protein FACS1894152_0670 [Bacilli bacterium]